MKSRILLWDGCSNVRDLGGLKTGDGKRTCYGAIIRADTPARLTAAGWEALYAYGARTIITLRTIGMLEEARNVTPPYADIAVVQAPIEDITDSEFTQRWVATDLWSTPLYYKDALQRWQARHAAVITAIAQAQPGGVLFHCIRGNDRTGIIALLLLALAGVKREEILADYALSPDIYREGLLAREHSSVREAIDGALDGLDIVKYLTNGGVSQEDIAAVRKRLFA